MDLKLKFIIIIIFLLLVLPKLTAKLYTASGTVVICYDSRLGVNSFQSIPIPCIYFLAIPKDLENITFPLQLILICVLIIWTSFYKNIII